MDFGFYTRSNTYSRLIKDGHASGINMQTASTHQNAMQQHPPPEQWFVAHTRPRMEKKLANYCEREGIDVTLPLYKNVCKYRGKCVTFDKPLFPNYVFFRTNVERPYSLLKNDYIVSVLSIYDQMEFERQLQDIMRALATGVEMRLGVNLAEGTKVRIKTGPLQGLTGYVEKMIQPNWIQLRLDFISQAVAVKIESSDVEVD